MKYGALCDDSTAGALELDWLAREILPAHESGRRAFAALEPFPRGCEREARARAQSVAYVAAALDAAQLDALRETLSSAPDAASAIARLSAGDTLEDPDLLILLRFCDGALRTFALAESLPGGASRSRAAFEAVRALLEPGRSGSTGFYLGAGFAEEIGLARDDEARAQEAYDAARDSLALRVGAALGRDDLSEGEFIAMRDAAPVPMPPGVRVIREAPTYMLCELELDETALAALRARDAAALRVAAAEQRAREALSARLRASAPGLEEDGARLGELDVTIAAAAFARKHACTAADIVDEAVVDVGDARFLPLEEALAREGRPYAPVSLDAHGVSVITGPNMGGKTTALRACGAIALYAAFGLPVPAARARVGLFDRIAWLGVGVRAAGQDSLLSAFASEVVRLRDALPSRGERVLFLSDELARTTTPHEAAALLAAIIRRLRERGACGLAATHVAGVAAAGGARHFAVRGLRGVPERSDGDLSRALASLAASMDYTLAEVSQDAPAQDDALALASLLGLDDEVIADARRFLRGPRRI